MIWSTIGNYVEGCSIFIVTFTKLCLSDIYPCKTITPNVYMYPRAQSITTTGKYSLDSIVAWTIAVLLNNIGIFMKMNWSNQA